MLRTTEKRNKKGFGLIELTLALAITAIVGFVVIRAYSNAKAEKDANEVVVGINTVQSAVESMYGSRRNYEGLEASHVMKLLPKSMGHDLDDENLGQATLIKLGSSARATLMPYSSDPTNSAGNGNHANTDTWMMNVLFLNDSVCRKLAAVDFGRHVKYVVVNNSSMNEGSLSISEANTLCNQEDGPMGNMLQVSMK